MIKLEDVQTEVEQTRSIIRQQKRRLHELTNKRAIFGISVPPEISIEIDDLNKEIAKNEEKAELIVERAIEERKGLLEDRNWSVEFMYTYVRNPEILDLLKTIFSSRRNMINSLSILGVDIPKGMEESTWITFSGLVQFSGDIEELLDKARDEIVKLTLEIHTLKHL